VIIAPYSAQWSAMFQCARAELEEKFGALALGIEHVGSTAVPGLDAKPVIDILLGAATLADIEARIPALVRLGYEYVTRFEAELPMRRYFKRSTPIPCQVHGVSIGSAFWRDLLFFRDALRADPALAAEYGALKRRLALAFPNAASRYTDAKGPFIRGVVATARRGASGGG